MSPLMFSVAGDLIDERMAQKGIRLAGVDGLEGERFFRLFGGQVYLNSHILEEVVRLIPSIFLTPEMLRFFPREIQEDFTDVHVSFFSTHTLRILTRLFGMDKDWAPFFNHKAFETTVASVERARRDVYPVDESLLSTEELLDRVSMLYSEMGNYLDVVTWGMVFAYVFHPLTEILARKWGQDEDGDLAAALTVGLEGVKTFDINREIEALAATVEEDPFLTSLFGRCRGATILRKLEADRSHAEEFYARFLDFIDQHGHRFHGRDLRYATWRECPEMVIDMIQMNRGTGRSREIFENQHAKRKMAEVELKKRVGKGLLGPAKLALFSLSLDYNQKYFVIRENMRYYSDIFLEQFRRLYLEIGRRWHRAGELREPEDIVYLSRGEIEQALRNGEGVRQTVDSRRKEYEQFKHLKTPEVITDHTRLQPVEQTREESGPFTLSGEVACPGVVSGPARVIRDPGDILSFRQGEVLVAEYTDPSWTPVLAMAAGIVIESGGFLSHGSIVAREYGIPTLIQVSDCVKRIRPGDLLHLNTADRCVTIERD